MDGLDRELLEDFAGQLGVDPDVLADRWHRRPDRIIDDLFRVRDIDSGELRELELFDVQREVVHAYFYGDAGTLNAYKGRRIGYSFVVVACFLVEGLLYPDSFYPLVSRSLSQAKDRISDIQDLIDHAKVEIPTEKENTDYIGLKNGSAFCAFSADSNTSRGADSARAVLLDEMAFIENEEEASRAFGAFLALGENRKMVQVSTPNTKNDLFMQTFRRGSRDGDGGVISIKQPTFANAEDIDIHTPLYDQELEPVRPDLNIDRVETERLSDPEGFGQEYLCRPVVDEYRFFSEEAIEAAQDRGAAETYERGLDASLTGGTTRVMGVDIGINRDDTVISVTDHIKEYRKQRLCMVVTDDKLAEFGLRNPDRANPNDIALIVDHIHQEMGVDTVILDKGGVGQGFKRTIERRLGREIIGFDFSDKEGIADAMRDMNAALRSDEVTLVPDDRLRDELSSVVKEKNDQYQKPKFQGKDHSETGKDDTAMATVLSAFPPHYEADAAMNPTVRNRSVETPKRASKKEDDPREKNNPTFGATTVSRTKRTRRNKYNSRRSR